MMATAATVNELVTALLNAQTATSPVTITLTGTSYDMTTSTIPRDNRFGTGGTASGWPHITKDVTILATSSIPLLTRSGVQYRHFFVVQGAKLTLKSVALGYGSVGNFDTGGGAIYTEGTVTLQHCKLFNNSSVYGGAIMNSRGSVDISNCDIYQNVAQWGGGLWNGGTANNCVMNITDTRIAYNHALSGYRHGGGIVNFGTLSVKHCMITGNTAAKGGGIANWDIGAQATIQKSHITINTG